MRMIKEDNFESMTEEIEKVLIVDLIGGSNGDLLVNRMMHAADMFEKGKQFAHHLTYEIKGASDPQLLPERFAHQIETSGGYAVFVGIRSINGKRPTRCPVWFMKDVRCISMRNDKGELCWTMFRDILHTLGYEVETNETMHVTSVR